MRTIANPLCPLDPGRDMAGFLTWHRDRFGTSTMTSPTPPVPTPAPAPAPAPPNPPTPPSEPDRGFPENTPLTEMSGDQREAYWKAQSRKHENTAKARGDYDDLKQKAARLAEIEAANATDQEKAVSAAKAEAATEERAKTAPRLVSAEFRAAAKGVLSAEQRDALLEDLDLTKYLTDTGEVDVAKVEKKVAAFAPKADDGKGKRNFPDLGQGKREAPASSRGAGGAAEAERRFKSTAKQ